jgi:hypothetical protein
LNTKALYLRIPDEEDKKHRYPENSWMAIIGDPQNLDICPSTHLFECPFNDATKELAKRPDQEWFLK